MRGLWPGSVCVARPADRARSQSSVHVCPCPRPRSRLPSNPGRLGATDARFVPVGGHFSQVSSQLPHSGSAQRPHSQEAWPSLHAALPVPHSRPRPLSTGRSPSRPPCAACCPVCLLFTVPAAAHGSSGVGTLSCLEQGRCPGTVEQISDRWTVRCDTKAGRSGASFSARPRSEAPQAAKSGSTGRRSSAGAGRGAVGTASASP